MKIGFMGMLQLIFITLKLTGYISWSWWLVLLPSIIYTAIFSSLVFLFLIIAYVARAASIIRYAEKITRK